MRLKQSDIFQGLNSGVLKEIMNTGIRTSYSEGQYVYHRGDPADYLYTLMEGEVRLHIGDDGTEVFAIASLGEVFGWSSLIGQERRTLSAVCKRQSTVFIMEKQRLLNLIEADTDSAITFYRRLAKALGNRLLQVYDTVKECKAEAAASAPIPSR